MIIGPQRSICVSPGRSFSTPNSALGDDVATKADIAAVKSDIRLLQWQIGIMYALQLAILVKLFVH